MRHWKLWLYLVGMIAILGLCVFASMPTAFTTPRIPTQVQVASQPELPADIPTAAVEPIVAPAVEEAEELTNTPTEAPEATEVANVDYCLTCHTDKDTLIQTASAEEEVPEESEGAG